MTTFLQPFILGVLEEKRHSFRCGGKEKFDTQVSIERLGTSLRKSNSDLHSIDY
jgi:hypothetical protein